MPVRPALSFVAAALLLLPACSMRLHAPVGAGTPHRSALGGTGGDGGAGFDEEHAGHTHEGHEHAQAEHGDDTAYAPLPHAHAGHDHDVLRRPLLRTNLRCGWCECPDHGHASVCGTPYVHGFLTEPAFLGRDLFLDVTSTEDETEVEAELEWSLTRRLGLIAELPYIDADESGIGDAAVGLRALLVEHRRFLLSVVTELELPTGSESKGLGEGAVAVGAGLHTWADLGSWVTLQTRIGLEHVPDEDESELLWSATLAKSFPVCPLFRTCAAEGHDHGPTTFDLLAEIEGATLLSEDAGETEGRWLLGVSVPLTQRLSLRGAFSRTFGDDEEEEAWTIGLIIHF